MREKGSMVEQEYGSFYHSSRRMDFQQTSAGNPESVLTSLCFRDRWLAYRMFIGLGYGRVAPFLEIVSFRLKLGNEIGEIGSGRKSRSAD